MRKVCEQCGLTSKDDKFCSYCGIDLALQDIVWSSHVPVFDLVTFTISEMPESKKIEAFEFIHGNLKSMEEHWVIFPLHSQLDYFKVQNKNIKLVRILLYHEPSHLFPPYYEEKYHEISMKVERLKIRTVEKANAFIDNELLRIGTQHK